MRHPWLVGSLLAEDGFEAFSVQHFGLLAITAGGVAGAVWWGRSQLRHRAQPHPDGGAHPVPRPVLPGSTLVRLLGPPHLRDRGGGLPRLGPRHAAMVALPDHGHRGPRAGCAAYTFNVVMDTNYGNLVRTPAAATSAQLVRAEALVPPGRGHAAPDVVGAGLHAAMGARDRPGVLLCRRRPAGDLSRS